EERLRLAAEAAGFGTYEHVLATGALHWSPEMKDIFGVPRDEELRGLESFIQRIHPEDRERVRRAMDASLDPGGSGELELEHRLVRADGSVRWVLARGRTSFEGEGARRRPVRARGTVVDITDRRRREDEQRLLAEVGTALIAAGLEYEETLSAIVRSALRDFADCCIVDVVEPDSTVRRLQVAHSDPAKSALCDALRGIRLDRRRPHLVREVLVTREPTLMSEVPPGYLESIAQGDEHLRALRELDPRSFIVAPLSVRGELLGVVAFITSQSSWRYGPRDVRVARGIASLAALALDNARLYDVARRAIDARDGVLGIVAHDLRNPLNAVVLQARLLRGRATAPEDERQRAADLIARAAARMNRLIQDMLDVARLETGALAIARDRLAVEHVVAEAVEAARAALPPASLALHVDIAGGLPDISADRGRLLQVLDNLISNAIKFTAPGGHITVGAAPREDEVLFRVADTGPGMPAEHVARAFDRFWQATKADRRGAGLGLPIVKGIVEAHGGRIWIESQVGVGTTFYFTLPVGAPAGPSRDTCTSPP
ncbi:MAG: PAS domain-containing sensor histidine kinase, partial [Polyangiaceae bacterium]|nr:PAS domain-containing sensor histidine kinase [Polyangiaceae bacterium]